MSLNLPAIEPEYGWLNMPPEAREEAFWIALSQCRYAAEVWAIVQRPSSRKLSCMALQVRPETMRRVSAIARRLPYDEIAMDLMVMADARPALPASFDFGI